MPTSSAASSRTAVKHLTGDRCQELSRISCGSTAAATAATAGHDLAAPRSTYRASLYRVSHHGLGHSPRAPAAICASNATAPVYAPGHQLLCVQFHATALPMPPDTQAISCASHATPPSRIMSPFCHAYVMDYITIYRPLTVGLDHQLLQPEFLAEHLGAGVKPPALYPAQDVHPPREWVPAKQARQHGGSEWTGADLGLSYPALPPPAGPASTFVHGGRTARTAKAWRELGVCGPQAGGPAAHLASSYSIASCAAPKKANNMAQTRIARGTWLSSPAAPPRAAPFESHTGRTKRTRSIVKEARRVYVSRHTWLPAPSSRSYAGPEESR